LFFRRGTLNTGIPNASLPGRKIPVPVIIAGLVAVVVFAGSVFFLQRMLKTESRTVPVPVAKMVIPQGATIVREEIEFQALPAAQPGSATDASQIVGKAALTTIYKGEQFRRERLGLSPSDKQEVTINIDLARSGLTKPGDLVDVYLLRDETTWAYRGELVALNAMVRSVRDQQGLEVSEGKQPAVVQLVVKSEETVRIIRGAGVNNASYALVKKYTESNAPVGSIQEQPPEQVGQGTGFNLEDITRAVQESFNKGKGR